jgi:hypothetical protein
VVQLYHAAPFLAITLCDWHGNRRLVLFLTLNSGLNFAQAIQVQTKLRSTTGALFFVGALPAFVIAILPDTPKD